MLARYAVLPASPPSSGPKQLLFYKFSYPVTSVKSTLLQVFSLKNLKPSGINTYEKQGEGWWLWLTKCSKKVSGGEVRSNPNLPFSVHTSKFRIPQVLCLPLLCEFCIPVVLAGRKHRGCGGILPILEQLFSLSASVPPWQVFPQRALQ